MSAQLALWSLTGEGGDPRGTEPQECRAFVCAVSSEW